MMPVSFRISHQKRSFVLKSAGNLIESYFGKKNKKRKNNQQQLWVFMPESDFIRPGFCFPYPSGLSPCSGRALTFPASFLKIQF